MAAKRKVRPKAPAKKAGTRRKAGQAKKSRTTRPASVATKNHFGPGRALGHRARFFLFDDDTDHGQAGSRDFGK